MKRTSWLLVAVLCSACSIERTSLILTPSDPKASIVAEGPATLRPDRSVQFGFVNRGPDCAIHTVGTVTLNYPTRTVHLPWELPPQLVRVNQPMSFSACCAPDDEPFVPTYLFLYDVAACPL